MKYKVTLNGKCYEIEVEKGEAILVDVSEVTAVPAPAAAPAPAPVAAAPVAAAPVPPPPPVSAGSGDVIKAPMPGTILAVKVAVGESVKKGQVLVVLEAMKMENDIQAPRDGVINGVAVSKGTTVETGAPLVTLG